MRIAWSGDGSRRGAGAGVATAAIAALLLVVGAGRTAAAPDASPGPARARFLMGTRLSIETDGPGSSAAFEAAFGEVARLEGILSNWRSTSEVSRLNKDAERAAVRCSADLFAAVDSALLWAERTEGAFDPTVEPLVRALGLRGADGRLPGTREQAGSREAGAPMDGDDDPAARLPIGWRHVRLDRPSRSVVF